MREQIFSSPKIATLKKKKKRMEILKLKHTEPQLNISMEFRLGATDDKF
jgi:hypothetical protein